MPNAFCYRKLTEFKQNLQNSQDVTFEISYGIREVCFEKGDYS